MVVFVVCGWVLGLRPSGLLTGGNWSVLVDFLSAALTPALDYERPVPGAAPFLIVVFEAVVRTVRYSVLAMSVAVPVGVILTFFASNAWWPRGRIAGGMRWSAYILSRALMAVARSIHELIWGLLFITAIGLSSDAAVIARWL